MAVKLKVETTEISLKVKAGDYKFAKYSGSYVITPSVSSQVISIADKQATTDITVNAIPLATMLSNASVSGSMSLSVDGSGNVTATFSGAKSLKPVTSNGWAWSSASLPVTVYGSGSLHVPSASMISSEEISANLSMSVDDSGMVTATFSDSKLIYPVTSNGYATSSAVFPVTAHGSGSLQLAMQSASTITPSTVSQVAVVSGKWTTGSVIVDAMPVGEFLPSVEMSLGSLQLQYTPSGAIYVDIDVTDTVTPMSKSGYMSLGESLNVHVSASPHGYLTPVSGSTFTPSTTSQVLASAYRWTTGSIIMDAIPSAYIIPSGTSTLTSDGIFDIASYASVLVSIGSNGNNLAYGISDGTIPKVGIAKVGSAKVV